MNKINVKVLNKNEAMSPELISYCKSELIARIFYNRGFKTVEDIKKITEYQEYIPTTTKDFKDLEKAVELIFYHINNNHKICIYGDYDVDGVTSTAVLVETLKKFTSNICYHVPDRFTEGYGMNAGVIKSLFGDIQLVITCDCGISNINEIGLAKELGMDVIVTDHHTIGDTLPDANIILNPKLLENTHPARNISGCCMAYFLCLGILEHAGLQGESEDLLDLVGLSLIADVVPLHGENRYLLKKGIPHIIETKRTGLRVLIDLISQNSKLETEQDIAFQIAPRINAAGRMESATLPVELLLTNDQIEALKISEKIDYLNTQRKNNQEEIFEEAKQMVEQKKKNKKILVLYSPHWHHGIIGIVAGKICENYNKPTILLSDKEDGELVVGSARSTDDINIYELLKNSQNKLNKFGGHSKAAGLSVKKEFLEDFIKEIEVNADIQFAQMNEINVEADMELDISNIDNHLYDVIRQGGPYGEGFDEPLFYSKTLEIITDRITQKGHHFFVLADTKNNRIEAVKWSLGMENVQGKTFDAVYTINLNTYKEQNKIQLGIKYLIESNKKLNINVFSGDIIDRRQDNLYDIFKTYSGKVYYEGLQSNQLQYDIIDSENLISCDALILYSLPQTPELLREVVAKTNPRLLILNLSGTEDYEFNNYIKNFLSVVKHVIHNKKGEEYLNYFSKALCVQESIIKLTLNYLQDRGIIKYIIDNMSGLLTVDKGDNIDNKNDYMKKKLIEELKEKTAYVNYLRKMPLEEFKKLFA